MRIYFVGHPPPSGTLRSKTGLRPTAGFLRWVPCSGVSWSQLATDKTKKHTKNILKTVGKNLVICSSWLWHMFTPQHRPYISLALTRQALSTWPKLLFTDWRKPGIGYARYCNGVWQIHWHFFLGHHAQRHWPLVLPWSQLSFMVTTILLLATRRTRPFVVLSCLIHKASLPCMMAEDKKKNIPTESTQLSFWLRLAHLAWPYSLEYDHWVNDANDPITTTGIIFSLMARDNVRATAYNAQVAVKRGLQLLWLPWIRSPQTHSLKNYITLSNQNILLQFSPVATPQLRMHPYLPS